jgi:ABC-2 type transport system ATP-binding protein
MSETILEVEDLVKDFGAMRAVDRVSFRVARGTIVGLLGPNGAGKTTTIHMLIGVTLPSGGAIRYFGRDFGRHRRACLQRINFTSAYNWLQGRISARENLLVFAHLYGVKDARAKIRALAEQLEAADLLDVRFWDLSAGQKTRVNLIKALLNDPELILMDEPTASLDPDIADKVITLIEQLRVERGLSILYTSHNMDEVARLCDEVIFLDRGRIVAQDTPRALTRRIGGAQLRFAFAGDRALAERALARAGQAYRFLDPATVVVETREPQIPEVIFRLGEAGIAVTDLELSKPTLEDVFLQIARGNGHVP